MKDSKTFKSMNVNLGRFHCTQIWLGILLTEVSLNLRVLTLPCNTKCIDTDCWQAMHTIIMYNARKFKWLTFLQDILSNNNRYNLHFVLFGKLMDLPTRNNCAVFTSSYSKRFPR